MSSFVSWDSKITTVNAILGGVSGIVRQKMKSDGIYNEFISVTQVRNYSPANTCSISESFHMTSYVIMLEICC
jgi:hypothetical protein